MTTENSCSKASLRAHRRGPRRVDLVVWGMVLGGTTLLRAAEPDRLYATHCALCHGKDGRANTPVARKLGVKDLTQSKATDAEIEKQLIEGKKDHRGNQKMPPFKDKLSPEEIRSLIGWVKALRK